MTKELENILKDKTLTKGQKIQIINQYYDNYRAKIDKNLNNYLAKQYIGAALEIGAATLPVRGAGKLGGEIGQQLKNYGNIDNLDEILRKQYSNDSKKFYQDYIQEIQSNKNGNFDFSKRGIQEQLRWNPQQAQNFPELVNDIKNAKRLPDSPNEKPLEKPDVSHYEVYRGRNGDHYIEVFNNGEKRYYITKDTPQTATHTTSTDDLRGIGTSLESPNNIIPSVNSNYNTQVGNNVLHGKVEMNVDNSQKSDLFGYTNPLTGSNHIYTREEVGSMTSDEFAKHEKAIDAQTKAFNGTMPTNGDLQREAMTGGGVVYVNSYTRSDGAKVRGYYRSRSNN